MAGDPHYNNVVLLLHCNGSNNSTTFTDNSKTPKAIAAAGNAKISTAQSKFGGASAYFDGSGDYCSTPLNADLDFETGDFTVECWVYLPGNSEADAAGLRRAGIIGTGGNTGSTTSWGIMISGSTTTTGTGLMLETYYNGTSYGRVINATITQNAWHHLAVVRSASATNFYIDGTKYSAASIAGPVNSGRPANTHLWIGRQASLGTWERHMNGYIDDLRITKGVARYTDSFTPPTEPFPDYAQQFKIRGTAQFTDGTIATLARAWRRDTGAFLASATPNPSTGAFEITAANTPCDISIFKDGYRPLTHGPITPIPE